MVFRADIHIRDLEISRRGIHCLESSGLHTIADIIAHTEAEILSIPNLGRITLDEIRWAIAKHGHCFENYTDRPARYWPFDTDGAALASPSHPVPTDVSQMIPEQKDKTVRTGPKEEFNLDWIIESFVLCLETLQNCPKPVHAGRVRNHVLSAKEFMESDAKMFSLLSDPVRTGIWKSAKRIGQAIYDTYGMDELRQIVNNLTDRQSVIADKVLDGVGKENDRWWC